MVKFLTRLITLNANFLARIICRIPIPPFLAQDIDRVSICISNKYPTQSEFMSWADRMHCWRFAGDKQAHSQLFYQTNIHPTG